MKDIRYHDTAFLASFTHVELMFEQLSVIYALPRYMAKRFRLILPYFATGTMERIDLIGQIATADTLSRILSVTPAAISGPSQVGSHA